jgi:hypothetical protein
MNWTKGQRDQNLNQMLPSTNWSPDLNPLLQLNTFKCIRWITMRTVSMTTLIVYMHTHCINPLYWLYKYYKYSLQWFANLWLRSFGLKFVIYNNWFNQCYPISRLPSVKCEKTDPCFSIVNTYELSRSWRKWHLQISRSNFNGLILWTVHHGENSISAFPCISVKCK